MIKEFKETAQRDSGVIYKSSFDTIQKLYLNGDKERAGELAISLIELVLTGEISSDDFMIELILGDMKVVSNKNKESYERKVAAQKQKRMEDLQLTEIAELYSFGLTQQQIADNLGLTQQIVSYRIKVITTEFPEIKLERKNKNTKNTKNTTHEDDDVDDNVNEDDNEDKDDLKYLCAKGTSIPAACAASASSRKPTKDEMMKKLGF